MPKRTDIKKILILGGGPVVIGQGCELDQLACQAIEALRAEGYKTVYVNSNPSAVSSDPDVADATYLEPLSLDAVTSIIQKEQPDALLPNYGGQTALNLTMQLSREYALKGLTLLGVDPEAITKVEDRRVFKETMEQAGLPVLSSEVAETIEQGLKAVTKTGFPAIIRSAYTTGGGGSAVAYNVEEFVAMVSAALKSSPVGQVLIEKAALGWKETELEVLRDSSGKAEVVACSESVDPAGVHTGDSAVVVPALTLSAEQVDKLEQMALKAVDAIGVVGAAAVRFAMNPETGEVAAMGASVCVGPLTSISSLLSGTPLGSVCARLAVGFGLDEVFTKQAVRSDLVTVKLPRFAFDRFPDADQTLGTSMRSIGEVIGVGSSFNEALQKAIRSLEIGRFGLGADGKDCQVEADGTRARLVKPNPRRLFYIKQALQAGVCEGEIAELSKVDPWFIASVRKLVEFEKSLEGKSLVDVPSEALTQAKALGYSDAQLAFLFETEEEQVRIRRKVLGIAPATAGLGERACYSSYGSVESCAQAAGPRKILVLGGGPNRIGQGGEFDYCRAHALRALSDSGYQGITVNGNPTAVIPGSARLFVDPQTTESVLGVIEREKPEGAIIQFAGQTLLRLGQAVAKAGVPVLGTSVESSARAKDAKKLSDIAKKLGIKKAPSDATTSTDEAFAKAEKIGYPLLLRSSRASGGHVSDIAYDADDLDDFHVSQVIVGEPLVMTRFLEGAITVGVDAISDGETTLICGVMEFIEQAGVHPGDSAGSLPPYSLREDIVEGIKSSVRALAQELGTKGLLGAQFAVKCGEAFLLDVQPRASRTVPFVSKATGVDWIGAATRIMLGKSLAAQGIGEVVPSGVSVKETVFPFSRFPNVDVVLGPEMRSTGEVIGLNASFGAAYIKAQCAAGQNLPEGGTAFLSVAGRDKSDAVEIGKRLRELGFEVVATAGTADALREAGVEVRVISKIGEGRPDAIDLIKNGEMDLIINTPSGKRPRQHEVTIRSATVARGIPIVTTMAGAKATLFGMEAIRKHKTSVRSLQE